MHKQVRKALCLFGFYFFLTNLNLSTQAQQTAGSPSPASPEKVTLTVTVTDRNHNPVTDLNASAFKLYDNDQPQLIASFDSSDIPVCIGLLVDSSGSMRSRQKAVNAALLDLIKAGNRENQIFLVNFNDKSYIDQDFTKDPILIAKGMEHASPRGGTAFYDGVIASADHLTEASECSRKALVAVSDGLDNESRKSLEQTLDVFQDPASPVVYVIALLDGLQGPEFSKTQHTAEALTDTTGGVALLIRNMKYLHEAALVAAKEIQTAYRIAYVPADQPKNGEYHKVRLEVHAKGQKDLTIHVRTGYTARK